MTTDVRDQRSPPTSPRAVLGMDIPSISGNSMGSSNGSGASGSGSGANGIGAGENNSDNGSGGSEYDSNTTWIHDIFQGTTVNETRCLCCETVTTRDEKFLDLSLEISHNSSITSCLRNFSKTETLSDEDKFYCDVCCSHQEATRRMRIKKLPSILALHLKRFKFVEHLGRLKKLSCRYFIYLIKKCIF